MHLGVATRIPGSRQPPSSCEAIVRIHPMRANGNLLRSGALLSFLVLSVGACSSGPDRGQLRLVMVQEGGVAGAVTPAFSVGKMAGDVPLESIESLVIEVVRVDLKPSSEPEEDDASWVRLPVTGDPVSVDLLLLPSVGVGVEVAAGEVAATSFKMVRLICSGNGTLTLDGQITLPSGEMIGEVGMLTDHPLQVPSCEQTGLKIQGATVNVSEGDTEVMTIVVMTDATVGTIKWTGEGFRMNPVMKLK